MDGSGRLTEGIRVEAGNVHVQRQPAFQTFRTEPKVDIKTKGSTYHARLLGAPKNAMRTADCMAVTKIPRWMTNTMTWDIKVCVLQVQAQFQPNGFFLGLPLELLWRAYLSSPPFWSVRNMHMAIVASMSVTAEKPFARPKNTVKVLFRKARTPVSQTYIDDTQPIPPTGFEAHHC